ncbi:MAG: TonB C-terminal domain-containing protein [Myxococcales bacterium]|nr:TonB C-terminal domain-containing protein [Myxococcales bacterium]
MFVQARDNRPPSMLNTQVWSQRMWVGGALIAVAAHILIPGLTFLGMGLLAVTGVAEEEPQTYIDENVVIAEFVRKGVKKDPNQLPDRVVPKKSTAPDKATVVSKNPDPPKPKKKEEEPVEPVEDILKRFGDNKAFAEISERELEGDPDGIEGGTATEAKAGNIWLGKLKVFIERQWSIPTTMGDTTHLIAIAEVRIGRDLRLGASKLTKSSGDPMFDQSLEECFAKIRERGLTAPEPPPEVADRYLGQPIGLRFKGKP